tara:strand:+ start:1213 stop:1659 length:447 start_codon:yes stop_codon:yes gene_type:complete
MMIFLLIVLFGPVIFMIAIWPFTLIVGKRNSNKIPARARYLSISIWPYVFYGSLIPLWLTLWIPSWLIYFLLPDVLAGIIMLTIWLVALFAEAGLFFYYIPGWLSVTLEWTEMQMNLLAALLLIPYLALIFYVFNEANTLEHLLMRFY